MVIGLIRFNTDEDRLEQYVNVATNSQPGWVKVKGGGASSGLEVMVLSRETQELLITILLFVNTESPYFPFDNAFTVGPVITVASGTTVKLVKV